MARKENLNLLDTHGHPSIRFEIDKNLVEL